MPYPDRVSATWSAAVEDTGVSGKFVVQTRKTLYASKITALHTGDSDHRDLHPPWGYRTHASAPAMTANQCRHFHIGIMALNDAVPGTVRWDVGARWIRKQTYHLGRTLLPELPAGRPRPEIAIYQGDTGHLAPLSNSGCSLLH